MHVRKHTEDVARLARAAGACALLCCLPVHAQGARMKIPPVPEGHPRVYVRPANLPAVRAKLKSPEFAEAWRRVRDSDRPLCKAFVYLVTRDEKAGREAVAQGLKNLSSGSDGRPMYNHMHFGACVYDWCYDLLSDGQKRAYIKQFKRFAAEDHNRGYPPTTAKRNPIVSHDCEGWIMCELLPAGVAVHDEDPEMYAHAARIFFELFVDACNFYYASHAHHQGTHYLLERFQHDQLTSWLFRRMGAPDVLSEDQHYVPYMIMYATRPDGKLFKRGDDNDDDARQFHQYMLPRLTSAYYGDPYLLTLTEQRSFTTHLRDFASVCDLLFLPARAPRRPLSELPLTKFFGPPMGDMIARTGWTMGADSRDALVYMIIGEHYFGNHHHRDFGTFQIFYRGALAIDAGVYQAGGDSRYGAPHWGMYYQQTVAHNGLMIFDPATARDDHGGERKPTRSHPRSVDEVRSDDFHWGRVTAHGFGPDAREPRYSYIAGDVTNAYYKTKVSLVTRAMAMLNTGDRRAPCVFAVFDRVTSTKPEFKKAWYLHTLEKPLVDDRTTTITCGPKAAEGSAHGGQLVVHTLLPERLRIDVVGGPGKECWNEVTGKNYRPSTTGSSARGHELGAWRMEVIPTAPAREDVFLNIMATMDAGGTSPPALPIRTRHVCGARLFDSAVVFRLAGRDADPVSFDVPGRGTCDVLVCGVSPGVWRADVPGGGKVDVEVVDDAGCAYFRARPGACDLRRVGSVARRPTRTAERTPPPAARAARTAKPGAVLMWDARLRKRIAGALAARTKLSFNAASLRQRVTVLEVDESGRLKAKAGPVTMDIEWQRLSFKERGDLSAAVSAGGEVDDHLMTAFYYIAAGAEDAAREHIQRAGEFAAMLDDFFEGED